MLCDRDCLHCPHPDCIAADEALTLAEYAEARSREAEIVDSRRSEKARKIAAKQAAYRDAHREEIAAYQAAYYDAHREEIAAKQAAYYDAHREKIAAYQAAYYDAHREEIAAKRAAYYDAHREEIAAKQAAYRDAHREALSPVGAQVRDLRKALSMSQTELGRHLGLSQRQVSYYERGEAPFDHERILGWLRAEFAARQQSGTLAV